MLKMRYLRRYHNYLLIRYIWYEFSTTPNYGKNNAIFDKMYTGKVLSGN